MPDLESPSKLTEGSDNSIFMVELPEALKPHSVRIGPEGAGINCGGITVKWGFRMVEIR